MSEKACLFCGQDGGEEVLLSCWHEGKEGTVCLRCFHPLLHGMGAEELKRRIKLAHGEQA